MADNLTDSFDRVLHPNHEVQHRMTHRILLPGVLIFLAAAHVSACSSQPPGPKKVYEEFHAALLRAGRGDPTALSMAMTHLSQSTLDSLSQKAEAISSSLPKGSPPVDPRQMLSVSTLTHDASPTDLEVQMVSQSELNIRVTIGEKEYVVPMVREGKGWKIDLINVPRHDAGATTQSSP